MSGCYLRVIVESTWMEKWLLSVAGKRGQCPN